MQKLPLIGFKDFGYSCLMKIIHHSKVLKATIFWLTLCYGLFFSIAIAQDDPTLVLKLDDSMDHAISINLLPPRLLEATVTIKGSFENMKGTSHMPMTIDVSAVKQDFSKPFAIFKGIAKDPAKEMSWDYKEAFQVGIRGGRHNDSIAYYLPYSPTELHEIGQGYGGSYSHQQGTNSEFAIDFDMTEGNVVCAARPGLVVAVRVDSRKGGPSQRFQDFANYIVIKHDDGTYARYQHLQYNGTLVRLGDLVRAGQPIGLAGSTGFVDGSHLHFEVYVPIDGERRQSIPVRFITKMGIMPMLQEGMSY